MAAYGATEVVAPRKGMRFLLEEKEWYGVWDDWVDWSETEWAGAKDEDTGSNWSWSKATWEHAVRTGQVTILEMGEDPPPPEDDEDDHDCDVDE